MSARLDSRSLALFLAVADTLSFRQAAEALHMSQPPLSRAVRELEEQLGSRLFDRDSQGVSLTHAGRKLLPYARGVAKLLREAQASLAHRGPPLTLRLGLTSAVEPKWFTGLAQRLQATHADTTVSTVFDTSPRLVRQLRAGKLEAAFIALPTEAPGLDVVELDRLPMMVAMASSHRLARRKAVRLIDLAGEAVFWFERARQPAFYDHCQRVFASHGFAPGKLKEPMDHHVLLADVAGGLGLALLPSSFAGLRRTGVAYRRLVEGDELAVGIGLATPQNKQAVRDRLLAGGALGGLLSVALELPDGVVLAPQGRGEFTAASIIDSASRRDSPAPPTRGTAAMSDLPLDARFEQAKARFLEGLRCFQDCRYGEAQQHYLASLEILPRRTSTLINLAATQLQLALPDSALASANQALAVDPGAVDAWLHRATALELLGRLDEALADYGRYLAADAGQPEVWHRQGRVLERLGRLDEALASYDKVLALDTAQAHAWSARGSLLREMNRPQDAAHAFRQALDHGADPDLHAYYLASVDPAQRLPASAPRAYVQALFDDYAADFDAHLLGPLNYQAHRHLVDAMVALGRGPYGHALDLGCGTGLCGPLLRTHAQRLSGLDLSPRMLDAARALGSYDDLIQGEMVEHLRSTADRYDLVLASDVFIYVGDLGPVFAAVKHAMEGSPGRRTFCFSVETSAHDRADFELGRHLRYAHSHAYLRRLAAAHGFEVLGLHRGVVRRDQRQPIDGGFVLLG